MYIICSPNNLGSIQAFIEPAPSSKHKYQAAIVELYFKISWKVDRGSISFYKNTDLVFSVELNQNDFISIKDLIKLFNVKISQAKRKKFTFVPPKLTYTDNQLYFDAGAEDQKFKVDEKFKLFFNISETYFSSLSTYVEPVLLKNRIVHVCSDIIVDQVVGLESKPIFRTIFLDSSEYVYRCFNFPHYIDVQKTDFNNINIWFVDESFNKLDLKNAYVKIHMKSK